MRNVPATKFKATCLELMDRVAEGHMTYVITKHGRPVAKLVPADPPRKKDIFGCMAHRTEVVADIAKPLWTEEQWKDFDREREQQTSSWDREWHAKGTIAGKQAVGQAGRRGKTRPVRTRKQR